MSDAFLDHGEIVSQRGEKTDIERYYAKPGDGAHGLPVVVLTVPAPPPPPRSSPARSDHHRALIMKRRSFGRARSRPCSARPETALRLTTARYFRRPAARCRRRIEPDIKVPQLTDPDYKSRPVFREADLQASINEVKADNAVLEEDTKTNPLLADPNQLKKRSRRLPALLCAEDGRARLGGATQVAAATEAAPRSSPNPTDTTKAPAK